MVEGKNVILVGFMGTGKTVVGRRLAAALGRKFVDTDAEVERVTGRTIPELFARYGEGRFRTEEARVLAGLCRRGNRVIATGGGAVLDPANVERLRESGVVVWLTAPPVEIWRRVGGAGGRPLLAGAGGLAKVEAMLAAREPHYRRAADFSVETGGRSVEAVVAAIIEELARRKVILGEGAG
ncbi:MAG: shikimate kinase [Clostridia bacterium]|nr:shikimate kinase [Clostridia bacterium]